MEAAEYELMDAVEGEMWWYRALHARLLDALSAASPHRLLDAGCGTGGFLSRLSQERPEIAAQGLEYDPKAAARAAQKSRAPIVVGSVHEIPFPDASFDAVVSADVLCQRTVDPEKALSEMTRVLTPGGLIALNLPAFTWMRSAHDVRVHSDRRFTASSAKAQLSRAGLAEVRCRYWNSLLFPVMVLQRKVLARGDSHESDVKVYSPWLNESLFGVTSIERAMLRRGVSFPAGGSILVTARKALASGRKTPPMPDPTEPTFALSIVVPVYLGAKTVGTLVEALSSLEPPGGLEIVLVNDGSPDESGAVCRVLAQSSPVPITYVEHTRNFGEHNAVMTGLRHARGDYVVTMDDDLQNPPSEALKLFEHARKGGFDVVYSRYARKKHAPWRNLGSRFANRVADALLDKPRGLYLSSFRCMSAFTVQAITRYEGPFPYVDGLIMQVTQRIDSIEVDHLERADGQSGYTLAKLVRLWLAMATNFSILPLRLALFLGVAMGAVGLLGAVAVVLEALVSGTPSGWASTMTALLLITSVQFAVLGVLGEYIGRAFLSVNGKPQGVVREVLRPASRWSQLAPDSSWEQPTASAQPPKDLTTRSSSATTG